MSKFVSLVNCLACYTLHVMIHIRSFPGHQQ